MKKKLLALMLLAGGSLFAQRFSIGVGIGTPGYYAPPPPVVVYRPPMPAPGYVWIDGYYNGYGAWTPGYWGYPPYSGAYWVAPRFYGGRYYNGYWGGPRFYGRGYYGRPGFRGGFVGHFGHR